MRKKKRRIWKARKRIKGFVVAFLQSLGLPLLATFVMAGKFSSLFFG